MSHYEWIENVVSLILITQASKSLKKMNARQLLFIYSFQIRENSEFILIILRDSWLFSVKRISNSVLRRSKKRNAFTQCFINNQSFLFTGAQNITSLYDVLYCDWVFFCLSMTHSCKWERKQNKLIEVQKRHRKT